MSGSSAQFNVVHLKKMKTGITLFNEGKYWECHEELEDHWLEDRGDNTRYVYWVVIQVATALYHYRDQNLAGARGMILKAQDKIEKVKKAHVESKLLDQFLMWKRFTRIVNAIPENPDLEDFKQLAAFKFSRPANWDMHIKKLEASE